MSDSSVTGTVKHVNDQDDKNYYGVKVGDTWYNGNGSTDLSEGDNIRIELRDEYVDDPTGEFIAVNDVEVVGSGSKQSSGEAEDSDKDAQGTGNGANHEPHISKDKRIMLQVAFKAAVDQSSADVISEQGRHLDEVSELTNGYYNLLEAQVKDKAENNGGGQ